MSAEMIALSIAGVGSLGLACQWIAWQLRLPAILFLLIAGILVGPVLGIFDPQATFGELFFPMVSLAVSVILFEGSLTLDFRQIKEVNRSVWSIVTVGAVISWLITAFACHYLLAFNWSLAFLFGSLTVVTGPTVIVPLLRTVRPKSKLANILRWEGILIDPLGALFVVMVYEFIVSQSQLHSLLVFGKILFIGLGVGAVAGMFVAMIIRHHWLPEYLQPFAVLVIVLAVFAMSNVLEEESGLLTVTVMGMWLANTRSVGIQHVLHFKEHLTVLFISGLFILLAARIDLADFTRLGTGALALFVVIQLVSRPVSIFLSTLRSSLSLKEKAFLAWVAPRGIVAAAVSALFAIKLTQLEVDGAGLLVPLIFMVIIGTVVLQSATARPIARWLGVAEPDPRGFLILGANSMARDIAGALKKYDCRVVLCDSNWDYIRQARMTGLENYYGNPTSSHADEFLDLIGLGSVLALTPDPHFNSAASIQLANNFGARNVFSLQKKAGNGDSAEKHTQNAGHSYGILWGGDVSYKKLTSLLRQGAEIRHTRISDTFSYEDYRQQYRSATVVPLFTVGSKNRVTVVTDPDNLSIKAGHTLVALIKEAEQHNRRSSDSSGR